MKSNYMMEDDGGLLWGPLIKGELIKRYKRFLADVRLPEGDVVTVHTPNTGSMKGCSEPGRTVYISHHDDPKRKLKYTWELIEMPSSWVGVNTSTPNRLVRSAVKAGKIPELNGYSRVKSEVKTGLHTRLDLVLENKDAPQCYIEIKNCTMVEDGVAMFPDAVTERGRKHLENLAELVAGGERGVIFFLVQRSDAECFKPADHIDPEYGEVLRSVVEKGVEPLVYDVAITETGIYVNRPLPIIL